jgi:aryl-alcohol dehydrogenase-like predicted oxidoreductase
MILRRAGLGLLFGAILMAPSVASAAPALVFEPYNGTILYAEDPDASWFPAAGRLADSGSILDRAARAHNATPSQIALAWVLKRSPVMLPIPGTSKVAHLEENVAVVNIELSDEEFDSLDQAGRKEYRKT